MICVQFISNVYNLEEIRVEAWLSKRETVLKLCKCTEFLMQLN